MIRSAFLVLFSILAFQLGSVFQQGEVQVKIEAPAQVNAGSSFQVELLLTKAQIESFSRFAQDIPPGLVANSLSVPNADFTFQDNRIRVIWLKLPSADTLRVIYEIKVDERLKGSFDLGGKFSYIENNQRKSVELESRKITILPSPKIDPRLIVDIKNFKGQGPDIKRPSATQVACIRQHPDFSYIQEQGLIIQLLVNKEMLEKFAKIEEQIPPGFSALPVETQDGIFTFRDQTAKFLWMNLPRDPWFIVSYKLVSTTGSMPESVNINGSFSFIDGTVTRTIPVVEQDVSFDNLSTARVNEFIQRIQSTATDEEIKIAQANQTKTSNTDNSKTSTNQPWVEASRADSNKQSSGNLTQNNTSRPFTDATKTTKNGKTSTPDPYKETGKSSSNRISVGESKEVMVYSLAPERGVYYRVQIAAGHRPVDVRRYYKKFEFREQVRTEKHDGWFKYSIGSWFEYKQARDYRVQLWNTTPLKDAFVTAYNAGKRITVQEALMISNQRWIQ